MVRVNIFYLIAYTCTGVENTKSNRFSQERPGTMQHMSSCVLVSNDMISMKYIITAIHGTPKISDTKNAVRHFLISSLQHRQQPLKTLVYHVYVMRALSILQIVLTFDPSNLYSLYPGC